MTEVTLRPIDRVGGPGAVKAVIDDFYEQVLADPALTGYFAGVDMVKQRNHLATLVVVLLGGTDRYDGRDLADAHGGLRVTPDAYDAVVGYLVGSLQRFGVPSDIIGMLGEKVAEVRPLIVADAAA